MSYQPLVGECLTTLCEDFENAHQIACFEQGAFFADENSDVIIRKCLRTNGCVLQQAVSVEIHNA
jgi:hypothetical protein